jgi:hypothetical protein
MDIREVYYQVAAIALMAIEMSISIYYRRRQPRRR